MSDHQSAIQQAINALIRERIELLDNEIKRRKELGALYNQEESHVKRLTRSQENINNVFDYGRDIVNKWAGALTASAMAHRAYQIAVSSSSEETERFLESAQGLDSITTSYTEINRRAREYQQIRKTDIRLAQLYNMRLEDVEAVTTQWLRTMRFVGGYTRENREEISRLTKKTVAYAKVLSITAPEMVQRASHRMFQFGESADAAMDNIVNMRSNVESLNKEMAAKYGLRADVWIDDFVKGVDEAAGRTQGWVQDLGTLSAAMAYSAKRAKDMGLSYNEVLASSKAMGQFITGGGEGAVNVNFGLRMLDKLSAARDKDTGLLSKEFLSQFNKEQGAEMQRTADMIGTTNSKDLALHLADSMSTTDAGVEEKAKLIYELGAGKGDVMPLLTSQFGMSREDALLFASVLKDSKDAEEFMAGYREQVESAKTGTEKLAGGVDDLLGIIRSAAGTTGFPVVDQFMEFADYYIGDIKAFFSDFETLAMGAFIAAAIGAKSFVASFGGIEGMMSGCYSMAVGIAAGMRDATIAARAYGEAQQMAAAATQTTAVATSEVAAANTATAVTGAEVAATSTAVAAANTAVAVAGAEVAAANTLTQTTAVSAGVAVAEEAAAIVAGQRAATVAVSTTTAALAAQATTATAGAATSAATSAVTAGAAATQTATTAATAAAAAKTVATGAAPAAAAGKGMAGGMLGNPLAQIAAFMAAQYLLSPDAEEDPDSMKEKAKGYGSSALNLGMLWSILGMPGKAHLGGLATKAGGAASRVGTAARGVGGALRVSGVLGEAATGAGFLGGETAVAGAASGMSTGVLATAGAGLLGAATAILGVPALALYDMASAATVEGGIRNTYRYTKHPLHSAFLSPETYKKYVDDLAKDPKMAIQLYNEHMLSDDMFRDVMVKAGVPRQDLDRYVAAMASPVKNAYTSGPASAVKQGAATTATDATRSRQQSTISGMKTTGGASVIEMRSDGTARLKVPLEFEVSNAMAPSIEYDKMKRAYGE